MAIRGGPEQFKVENIDTRRYSSEHEEVYDNTAPVDLPFLLRLELTPKIPGPGMLPN